MSLPTVVATEQDLSRLPVPTRIVDITFPIITKKSEQQLLLQELFLEFATDAVLTPSDI